MANPVDAFWFDSTMNGAPVLTGEVGKRIGVLDACLLSGFGSKTLSSLTVSSGVATGVVSAGHQLTDYIVGLIEGSAVSELNGKKRITVVNSTTFTFDATGIADQTATGTITIKVAPVPGWEKTYSGTNKAAYRSTAMVSNGRFLRVDDTGTSGGGHARVVGYENMSGIDAGTGPCPTSAQQSGGGYWYGSNATDSTARQWALYADSAAFVFVAYYGAGGIYPIAMGFGDIVSEHAGDAFGTLLMYGTAASPTSAGTLQYFNTTTGHAMFRDYTQTGTAIQPKKFGSGRTTSGMGYSGFSVPNPGNNRLYAQRVVVADSDSVLRGFLAGVFAPLNTAIGMTDWEIRSDVTGLAGRRVRVQKMSSGGTTNYAALIDLTGPWR